MNPTRQGLNQLLKIWILCLFCKSVISSYYICQFCYFCNKWFELIVFICDFCIQVLDVKRLIVIICPNILLFTILKIPSATPGDNLILWTSAVRSLTGPDSLVGWPQICGCYVISLPPKWGAPWGTLCYHSLIVGPFFRRLLVAGKTFPAFSVHAQTAILRIWQEAYSLTSLVTMPGRTTLAQVTGMHKTGMCSFCIHWRHGYMF